jgi:hypothetical protein
MKLCQPHQFYSVEFKTYFARRIRKEVQHSINNMFTGTVLYVACSDRVKPPDTSGPRLEPDTSEYHRTFYQTDHDFN